MVGGRRYRIHSDFRYALLLLERLQEGAPAEELDFMYISAPPPDREAGLAAIAEWLSPAREIPRPAPFEGGEILLDYRADAELIFAAFWEAYGIDLLDERLELHWHKFLALLAGLHGTRLNEVQGYRAYRPRKGEQAEFRKEMLRLKEMWRVEPRLTAEERAALDRFDAALRG